MLFGVGVFQDCRREGWLSADHPTESRHVVVGDAGTARHADIDGPGGPCEKSDHHAGEEEAVAFEEWRHFAKGALWGIAVKGKRVWERWLRILSCFELMRCKVFPREVRTFGV